MAGRALAAIVSGGISKFGVIEGRMGRELFAEAVKEAYSQCPNLNPKKDIQALYVGHFAEAFEHQGHTGSEALDWAGLGLIPAVRVEAACASSGAALRQGVMAIQSGLYDVVMVGGLEKMNARTTPEVTDALAMAADLPLEQWNGITFPGQFALMATAHMNRYGTTEEQMGMVAVKNHYNGARNPKAHLRKEITLQQALSSKMVAWPLKLYDCSLITDGGSCLILTKPDLARKFTDTPVYIEGSALITDALGLYERDDYTSVRAAAKAAREAYRMAEVEPKDINVAEVHDCFTIAEIIAYEDLGFCPRGEGGKLVAEGVTQLEGRLPVNTSGGLKSKGHPVGATGAAQAYEVFLQLTGRAGQRQKTAAQVGLTHNVGGAGSTAVVHIYRRGN